MFKLQEPRLRALNLILDWYQMLMQAPEVVDEHGGITDWRQGVGTGPYEMTDWVLGSSFEYTRNPNYWGFDEKWPENRLPYIEKIYGLVIVEHATRIAGLRAGTIDYIGHPGSTQIFDINQSLSLQRTHPEINQYPWSQRSDNCAGINTTVPPFDDVRVRRAMQMALDLDTMNDSYYKGLGGTDSSRIRRPQVSRLHDPVRRLVRRAEGILQLRSGRSRGAPRRGGVSARRRRHQIQDRVHALRPISGKLVGVHGFVLAGDWRRDRHPDPDSGGTYGPA